MTTLSTQQLAALEAKIRASVPDKTWRFVKTDFPTAHKILGKTKHRQHHEKCSYRTDNMLCDCAAQDAFIKTCILCNEETITLQDLLLALQKSYPGISINAEGDFIVLLSGGHWTRFDSGDEEYYQKYDLHHDLHWNIENNPEFASFLYSLLIEDDE